MEKFIIMRDISSTSAYKNVNARLLYLHLCCQMDIYSRTLHKSLRVLASELDMTVKTVRCALEALEGANLIDVVGAQGGAQRGAQRGAQIIVKGINELQPCKGTEKGTERGTERGTINNNKKISEEKPHTHDARAYVRANIGVLADSLGLDHNEAAELLQQFFKRQDIKKKVWESPEDCLAHAIAWIEKRLPKKAAPPRGKKGDHEARTEEYMRTKEEEALKEQKVKEWEEVTTVYGWWQDAVKKKETERAAQQYDAYMLLRGRWEAKWKPKE